MESIYFKEIVGSSENCLLSCQVHILYIWEFSVTLCLSFNYFSFQVGFCLKDFIKSKICQALYRNRKKKASVLCSILMNIEIQWSVRECGSEHSWGRLSNSEKNFILEIWFLSVNYKNITAHAFLIPSCPRF